MKRTLASLPTLANTYFASFAAGVDQAAKALGVTDTVNSANNDFNAQLAAVRNALTTGSGGLICQVNADAQQAQITRQAQQLGLKTVNQTVQAAWQATPYDIGANYVAFRATDGITWFQAIATAAFEEIGGAGNVLYISGIEGNTADTNRTAGFQAALKNYPGIHLLEQRSGGWTQTAAGPVVDDLLGKYPDVHAIVCSNDEEALAAVASLEAHNRKAVVTGADAEPNALKLISQGRMFATFAQHATWTGGYSLVTVFDAMNGWTPSPLERMMYYGGLVIDTAEAATAYNTVMYGSAAAYDFKAMSHTLNPQTWDPQNALVPMDLERLWSASPKPAGYNFPPDYANAWPKDVSQVSDLYASHFKNDPLQAVRKLTKNGGKIVTTS